MDWNKKIYPSDILRTIYRPFKPFMNRLKAIWKSLKSSVVYWWDQIFDVRWKGYHENKKFIDENRIREYVRETRRFSSINFLFS